MAIKDWKKSTYNKGREIRFNHKKKPFGFVRIIKYDNMVSPSFYANKWIVTYEYVTEDGESERENHIKSSKTKSEALKYAKEYMRKN